MRARADDYPGARLLARCAGAPGCCTPGMRRAAAGHVIARRRRLVLAGAGRVAPVRVRPARVLVGLSPVSWRRGRSPRGRRGRSRSRPDTGRRRRRGGGGHGPGDLGARGAGASREIDQRRGQDAERQRDDGNDRDDRRRASRASQPAACAPRRHSAGTTPAQAASGPPQSGQASAPAAAAGAIRSRGRGRRGTLGRARAGLRRELAHFSGSTGRRTCVCSPSSEPVRRRRGLGGGDALRRRRGGSPAARRRSSRGVRVSRRRWGGRRDARRHGRRAPRSRPAGGPGALVAGETVGSSAVAGAVAGGALPAIGRSAWRPIERPQFGTEVILAAVDRRAARAGRDARPRAGR